MLHDVCASDVKAPDLWRCLWGWHGCLSYRPVHGKPDAKNLSFSSWFGVDRDSSDGQNLISGPPVLLSKLGRLLLGLGCRCTLLACV